MVSDDPLPSPTDHEIADSQVLCGPLDVMANRQYFVLRLKFDDEGLARLECLGKRMLMIVLLDLRRFEGPVLHPWVQPARRVPS